MQKRLDIIEKAGEVIKNLPDLEIADLKTSWKIGGETGEGIAFDDLTIKISVKNTGNMDIPRFKILVERKKRSGNSI